MECAPEPNGSVQYSSGREIELAALLREEFICIVKTKSKTGQFTQFPPTKKCFAVTSCLKAQLVFAHLVGM